MKYVLPEGLLLPLQVQANKPTGDAAKATQLPLTWRGAVGDAVKTSLSPPAARLQGSIVTIGDESVRLNDTQAAVLTALAESPGGLTQEELADKSGYSDARRVLTRLLKTSPILAPYITCPGKRNGGGYRTTIRG